MEDDHQIGIVNSSTFGVYHSDLRDRLTRLGTVKRFEFDSDISGERLAKLLKAKDFLIASVTPSFTEEFFQGNNDVKLIARHGIGCDNVDIEAATSAGVVVTRVLGIHERNGVAELAAGLALNCLRQINRASDTVQNGLWNNRKEFVGREISRARVGIIGYGNIGSRVAEIMSDGFRANVMAHDPNIARAVIENDGVKSVSLEELLSAADLVSLNASLNEGNHQMLGREEFKTMKDDAVLVNTARGQLVDEKALAEALAQDEIGAAGLDVTQSEPINPDNPLLDREDVLIVPHIGGYSDYSLRKMDEKMVEDIEAVSAGRLPEVVVNPKVFRQENRAGIHDEPGPGN
ncbi:hydroxyacid dehydrogenase [Candidatus Bipolaricaulota bacterium]|nr:hydroxyacid dehydrogenase [Candidatus Bipolaricaulota bacterium]